MSGSGEILRHLAEAHHRKGETTYYVHRSKSCWGVERKGEWREDGETVARRMCWPWGHCVPDF